VTFSGPKVPPLPGKAEPFRPPSWDEMQANYGEEEEEETSIKKGSKVRIQRYKGLGEMNAEELAETTMNINNRILKRVAVEDAQNADRVFDVLMGTDVSSRKSFIQSNAKMAQIDI
jgi:DNA gyrase subunit B